MSVPYYTTMPAPPRRHPLATAANHYAVNQVPRHVPHVPAPAPGTPPAKQHRQHQQPLQQHHQHQQQQEQKQPASPPLPRQNAKVTPPSPPKIIADKTRTLEYLRVGMLGEVSVYLCCSNCALPRCRLVA